MEKIEFTLGCLSPPLKEQLPSLNDPEDHLQKDSDAISRLSVRGVLTDREVNKARDRLSKRIFKSIYEMTMEWTEQEIERAAREIDPEGWIVCEDDEPIIKDRRRRRREAAIAIIKDRRRRRREAAIAMARAALTANPRIPEGYLMVREEDYLAARNGGKSDG